jgi:hypothetical protein
MRIYSQAGEFEIKMNNLVVEGDDVIIQGKLGGLYPAKVLNDTSDLLIVIRQLIRPRVLLYLLTIPFYLLFGTEDNKRKNELIH